MGRGCTVARPMRHALRALVLATVLLIAAAPAHGATEKQLRAQVKALKKSRDTWKQRARDRQDVIDQLDDQLRDTYNAVSGDLADRVRVIAQAGRVTDLHRYIFEPIRSTWPCGSTLYQGQYAWSVDVTLEDSDFVDGEIVTKSCRG